eukprot:CAMPEP_0198493752 /NCGR_PEP_ID=MMETSP1462-20131121/4208_1 /TAXON_ID=1333877 /ORGANISM="Brandtodinium nutriculum, Strain RCC3387" /LENGTH=425 /DNA_ID=CAMNT_0044222465 /DNA_START=99 /DNA_END=1376 /DNA_ORIENTATION=-
MSRWSVAAFLFCTLTGTFSDLLGPNIPDCKTFGGLLDKLEEKDRLRFNVGQQWRFLNDEDVAWLPRRQEASGCWAAAAMTCLNMRGAIALGRAPEAYFTLDQMYMLARRKKGEGGNVGPIFRQYFGGYRWLDTVDKIKEELLCRGPVVSTDYKCTKAFNGRDSAAFTPGSKSPEEDHCYQGLHSMVIMGWDMEKTGQVWIVRNSWGPGSRNIKIAFGQFGIDENVIAPGESIAWETRPAVSVQSMGRFEFNNLCFAASSSSATTGLVDLSTLVGKHVRSVGKHVRSVGRRVMGIKWCVMCEQANAFNVTMVEGPITPTLLRELWPPPLTAPSLPPPAPTSFFGSVISESLSPARFSELCAVLFPGRDFVDMLELVGRTLKVAPTNGTAAAKFEITHVHWRVNVIAKYGPFAPFEVRMKKTSEAFA